MVVSHWRILQGQGLSVLVMCMGLTFVIDADVDTWCLVVMPAELVHPLSGTCACEGLLKHRSG